MVSKKDLSSLSIMSQITATTAGSGSSFRSSRRQNILWDRVTPTRYSDTVSGVSTDAVKCNTCAKVLHFKFGKKIERLREHFGLSKEYARTSEGGCKNNPFPKGQNAVRTGLNNFVLPAMTEHERRLFEAASPMRFTKPGRLF